MSYVPLETRLVYTVPNSIPGTWKFDVNVDLSVADHSDNGVMCFRASAWVEVARRLRDMPGSWWLVEMKRGHVTLCLASFMLGPIQEIPRTELQYAGFEQYRTWEKVLRMEHVNFQIGTNRPPYLSRAEVNGEAVDVAALKAMLGREPGWEDAKRLLGV